MSEHTLQFPKFIAEEIGLHENEINCRVDQQGTRAKLYVLPHDAARAREIVREVVEGQPPE